MSIKKIILWIILLVCICSGVVYSGLHRSMDTKLDITAVNDIAQSLAKNWDNIDQMQLTDLDYGMDYVVLDNDMKLVKATRRGLNEDINTAISNRDTIFDIKRNEEVLGKLIIYNDIQERWTRYRNYLFVFAEMVILFAALASLAYYLYIDRSIFQPFRRLKLFASHIAAGNLDVPMEMDERNIFGAFTESFDIMREELKKARESERMANQSKKELVASLSHDIKTPVASIMAVAEIMAAKSQDMMDQKQLNTIYSKAEQINTLIMNMFNATLEELQELKVNVTEQSSQILYELIKKADYNDMVTYITKAECIVHMDELRLAQVIDNVISNSYKYAGTVIDVSVEINGEFLEVAFQDYGTGVNENELPLLCNKYYRAGNSQGKGGTGLGLYISKYLMSKMSGDILCENTEKGFRVKLKLLIT